MSVYASNSSVGRPSSSQVIDLHVYVVPPELWRENLHSAVNEIVSDTISAGFIRVHPETRVEQFRGEITQQLGTEVVPESYVFLRSVGRCLTQLRTHQERELKAKHFIPPHAYLPELFVLDSSLRMGSQLGSTPRSRQSQRSDWNQGRGKGDYAPLRREEDQSDRYDSRAEDSRAEDSGAEQYAGMTARSVEAETDEPEAYRTENETSGKEEDSRAVNGFSRELSTGARGTPPPLTEGERQDQKDMISRLKAQLMAAKASRQDTERERERLIHKAKALQAKTQDRRTQARDIWKKRYYEEKKKTPPLEEQVTQLRHELEVLHRRLLQLLEKQSAADGKFDKTPSEANNYRIAATRLRNEMDDLKHRVETSKLRLSTEMKLRNQAETELRALRAELTQKKIGVTLTRTAHFLPPDAGSQSPRSDTHTPRSQALRT